MLLLLLPLCHSLTFIFRCSVFTHGCFDLGYHTETVVFLSLLFTTGTSIQPQVSTFRWGGISILLVLTVCAETVRHLVTKNTSSSSLRSCLNHSEAAVGSDVYVCTAAGADVCEMYVVRNTTRGVLTPASSVLILHSAERKCDSTALLGFPSQPNPPVQLSTTRTTWTNSG